MVIAGLCQALGMGGEGLAQIELVPERTLGLEEAPLDPAVTADGKRVFVLAEKGRVLIYTAGGDLQGALSVDPDMNRLEVAPAGDRLFLSSGAKKSVQIAAIDMIQTINIAGSPFKGAADAPVVVTVFDDFQCPYCAKLVPVLAQLPERYPGQVKVVFKHFPLRNHPYARKAAIAAMAAHEQQFWPFHDKLFAQYNRLDDGKIRNIAVELGLDMERFDREVTNRRIWAQINRDAEDGKAAGVRGTSSVFVNGRKVKDRSLEGFGKMIERELARETKAAR